jgi:hypothetical protein
MYRDLDLTEPFPLFAVVIVLTEECQMEEYVRHFEEMKN